jgi:hypothetical protein
MLRGSLLDVRRAWRGEHPLNPEADHRDDDQRRDEHSDDYRLRAENQGQSDQLGHLQAALKQLREQVRKGS